ncbi:hypothetical protein LCGC14_2761130, partial [marine sediment metagenome]
MSITFAEKLSRIPHYEAGAASVDAVESGDAKGVARLAANESPFPPVPGVVEAVREAATTV